VVDIQVHKLPVCDKCGEPVALMDDMVAFDWLMFRKQAPFMKDLPLAVFRLMIHGNAVFSRHIFPKTNCEGSPSRAQYLGEDVDERWEGKFARKPELEEFYKQTYEELRECALIEGL
jgi:hypothetical protein